LRTELISRKNQTRRKVVRRKGKKKKRINLLVEESRQAVEDVQENPSQGHQVGLL
jgi:hypothetical protein